jgi:L-ribulose-5-phosphate 3-epimerase
MLLGYNTNGFTSHGLSDALSVIATIGYSSVGLTIDHHTLNPFRPEWRAEAARCRQLLQALNLTPVVETGARYLLDPWRKHQPTLLDDREEERRRREEFLEWSIDAAAEIGSKVVSFWSGIAPEGAAVDALDRRLAGSLERLAERAAKRGVVLALEPEPGMLVSTMADFERVRALVPHEALRLTLDIGHAHLTEADGAAATVRRFAPLIANVHLEGMARPHHNHLPPWEGDLAVADVLRTFAAIGYRGPATFELSRHSHDAVDTARRAFDFAQQALGA